MGFKVHYTDDGRTPSFESMPASEGLTPRLGMALKLEEGRLSAAQGAQRPAYISMTERETPCADGESIPVIRAGADIVFETVLEEAPDGVKPGDRLTLTTDGMSVTATKGGAAEVVSADEGAVRVRFGVACEACE